MGEQFYFVIAVLVIGFLNWLIKKFQESKQDQDAESLRREMEELDPEARAELERRNTQPQQPGQPQTPPQNPLRGMMSELLGIPQEAKAVPPPLPLRQQAAARSEEVRRARNRIKPERKKPRELTTAEQQALKNFRSAETRSEKRSRRSGSSNIGAIRKQIAEPGGLKRAVVFREILGPPQSMKP